MAEVHCPVWVSSCSLVGDPKEGSESRTNGFGAHVEGASAAWNSHTMPLDVHLTFPGTGQNPHRGPHHLPPVGTFRETE